MVYLMTPTGLVIMNWEEVEQSRPTSGMSWYMLDRISDKTGNVHITLYIYATIVAVEKQ
jgi:hypothetical protein